jgi:hypothetical protein
MTKKTVTIEVREDHLAALIKLAETVAEAADEQATRTPLDPEGIAHSVTPAERVTLTREQVGHRSDLNFAAHTVKSAWNFTRNAEHAARVRVEKEQAAGNIPADDVTGFHVSTRPQLTVNVSVHGSLQGRQAGGVVEATEKAMMFANHGNSRDNRRAVVRESVWCG